MKRAGLLGEAALVIGLGPFVWEFASRHMEAKTFITAEIGAAVAAGAALLLFGHLAPWLFCAAFAVFAIVEASLRPLSTNILLSKFRDVGGTTASASNFASTVQGSLGMFLVGDLGTDQGCGASPFLQAWGQAARPASDNR